MSGQAVLEKYDPLIRRGQAAIPSSGKRMRWPEEVLALLICLTQTRNWSRNFYDGHGSNPWKGNLDSDFGSPTLRPIDSARD